MLNDNDAIHVFTYAADGLYVQFKKRDKCTGAGQLVDSRMHFRAKVPPVNVIKFVIIAIFVILGRNY